MIRLLTRYLLRQIILATCFVLLVFLAIIALITFIEEIRHIATYGHIGHLVTYVLMALPYKLYDLMPLALLFGAVLAVGQLEHHRELLIWQAMGTSMLQISLLIVIGVGSLLVCLSFLGEFVAVPLWNQAEHYKSTFVGLAERFQTLRSGVWLQMGDKDFLYVRSIKGKVMYGIDRYRLDEHNHLYAHSHAERGICQPDGWNFYQIVEQKILPINKQLSRLSQLRQYHIQQSTYAQERWSLSITPAIIYLLTVQPQRQNLYQLYRALRIYHKNQRSARGLSFVFWQRLTKPINTLVILIFVIPFAFSLRVLSGNMRTIVAIIGSFLFYTLNDFLGSISIASEISPWLASILPSFLWGMLGIGTLVIYQYRHWLKL